MGNGHFYPRPPRGGRRTVGGSPHGVECISIHALREEGDVRDAQAGCHAQPFLSTPSARRATEILNSLKNGTSISIHALREEGDRGLEKRAVRGGISIHALREEGDFDRGDRHRSGRTISIHALREEGDGRADGREDGSEISIHALREEGDTSSKTTFWRAKNFYPRPPRGGRRPQRASPPQPFDFYPRPPRGGRPR